MEKNNENLSSMDQEGACYMSPQDISRSREFPGDSFQPVDDSWLDTVGRKWDDPRGLFAALEPTTEELRTGNFELRSMEPFLKWLDGEEDIYAELDKGSECESERSESDNVQGGGFVYDSESENESVIIDSFDSDCGYESEFTDDDEALDQPRQNPLPDQVLRDGQDRIHCLEVLESLLLLEIDDLECDLERLRNAPADHTPENIQTVETNLVHKRTELNKLRDSIIVLQEEQIPYSPET